MKSKFTFLIIEVLLILVGMTACTNSISEKEAINHIKSRFDETIEVISAKEYRDGYLVFFYTKDGLFMNYAQKKHGEWYVDGSGNADLNPDNGISIHSSFDLPNSFYYLGGIITDPEVEVVEMLEPYHSSGEVIESRKGLKIWYTIFEQLQAPPEPPYRIQGLNKDGKIVKTFIL